MALHYDQPSERDAVYRRYQRSSASGAWEHREGIVEGFTTRYGLKRLVYFEGHETILGAIQREKTMKHWRRAWKVRLIMERNPGWLDLYDLLA